MTFLHHRWSTKRCFGKLQVALGILLALVSVQPASAQQQQRGLCARVKIVILQELALERVGFEATLENHQQ